MRCEKCSDKVSASGPSQKPPNFKVALHLLLHNICMQLHHIDFLKVDDERQINHHGVVRNVNNNLNVDSSGTKVIHVASVSGNMSPVK